MDFSLNFEFVKLWPQSFGLNPFSLGSTLVSLDLGVTMVVLTTALGNFGNIKGEAMNHNSATIWIYCAR